MNVKSEIMYFLVNASPPKRMDVATSNFADALVSSVAGICDGLPSTEVQFCLFLSGCFTHVLLYPVNMFYMCMPTLQKPR